MKKQIIILFSIMSILVSSCSKERVDLNFPYFGFAKAKKITKIGILKFMLKRIILMKIISRY